MLGICFRCCIIYFSLKLWIQSNMTRFVRLQVFESEYVSVHVNVGERSLRPNIAVVFFPSTNIVWGTWKKSSQTDRSNLPGRVRWCPEKLPHESSGWALETNLCWQQSREEVIGSHKRRSEGRGGHGHCFISWNSSGAEQLSVSYNNFFGVILYKPC